ncbi:MAG TPA: hypothetical protein VK769_00105, partial [Verrucomicrobiae bacterium]|nr:hypothetical protein [Verrucomicrobiae bacterium]
MSEFKFTCPICGQNILGDTVLGGTQLNCPHCNNSIGVPKEFAEHADVSAGTEIPPALPGNITATAP